MPRPARWLAATGATAVIGTLATIAATLATALAAFRARHEIPAPTRLRLALLLTAGLAFVPWALQWRLLVP